MILITGANGVVGQPLIQHLSVNAIKYLCVSRRVDQSESDEKLPYGSHVSWDLSSTPTTAVLSKLNDCDKLIHCAPIWLLPPQLDCLSRSGIKHIVVFSSTSVISKVNSSDDSEQDLVSRLANAEAVVSSHCRANNIRFTILRPSMIYGYGRDQNVSHIAQFIRKRGFMVLIGKASGLRQPVHADDLVNAALAVMQEEKAANQTYNLAGEERLSYRVMVERIFSGLDRPQRIINLPLWIFRIALKVASLMGNFNYTPEMADRMRQDLVYSNQAAINDFGYKPQAFLQNPKRDLPKK